jgi:wyosine [tRNA(Phe)-imidazoG37] synthetase (radical SAM superfamily)
MISFGPIPSRRLGKSLGINNIFSPKVCTYGCVYCQVGKTKKYSVERQTFFEVDVIFNDISQHLKKLGKNDFPDYLTFVSNGEPTLDINLGEIINKLKIWQIPIAVITNASLLSDENVVNNLMLADWVSVKIDASDNETWQKIDAV